MFLPFPIYLWTSTILTIKVIIIIIIINIYFSYREGRKWLHFIVVTLSLIKVYTLQDRTLCKTNERETSIILNCLINAHFLRHSVQQFSSKTKFILLIINLRTFQKKKTLELLQINAVNSIGQATITLLKLVASLIYLKIFSKNQKCMKRHISNKRVRLIKKILYRKRDYSCILLIIFAHDNNTYESTY